MAKRAGAFKSEKRKKELSRIKKREEKMQRKIHRKVTGESGPPIEGMEPDVEAEEGAPEVVGEDTAAPVAEEPKP